MIGRNKEDDDINRLQIYYKFWEIISSLFVLVLTRNGTEDIEKLRGNIYNSDSVAYVTTKVPVVIPKKIQLLILNEYDMSHLLGYANLKCLRRLK